MANIREFANKTMNHFDCRCLRRVAHLLSVPAITLRYSSNAPLGFHDFQPALLAAISADQSSGGWSRSNIFWKTT